MFSTAYLSLVRQNVALFGNGLRCFCHKLGKVSVPNKTSLLTKCLLSKPENVGKSGGGGGMGETV